MVNIRFNTRQLISVLLSISCLLCLAGRTLALGENIVEDQGIVLTPFDLSTVESEQALDIENILYPSGMQLPTKYLDLMDFCPHSGQITSNRVTQFLNTFWPSCNGMFTYPEYRAAERFCFYIMLVSNYSDSPVGTELLKLDRSSSWNLIDNISNVTISDVTHLRNALIIYHDLLTTAATMDDTLVNHPDYKSLVQKRSNGVILSTGESNGFDIDYPENNEFIASGLLYSELVSEYAGYWKFFSLTFTDTNLSARFIQEDNLGVVLTDPEGNIIATTKVVASDSDDKIKDNTTAYHSRRLDPLYAVGNRISLMPIPTHEEKIYNALDVFTVIAVICTVISIVVLWILHEIKKREDPIRKWRLR